MSIFSLHSICKIYALMAVFLIVAGVTSVQAQDLPKTTHDGLVLVENTEVKAVYMDPGATLEIYKRVAIADVYVAFKKNWQRDFNRKTTGLAQRVSAQDMEKIQQEVADEFMKVLIKELDRMGHDVVDVTGDDVLIIKPSIINLVVSAPETRGGGRNRTLVADAGEMTLYMEFYDSMTNDRIGIAIDPRVARNPGGAINFSRASRVSNRAAADILFKEWARLLISHLGAIEPSTKEEKK